MTTILARKSKYQQTKRYPSTILNILVKVFEYLVMYFERVWVIVQNLFPLYECVLYETVLNLKIQEYLKTWVLSKFVE